MFYSLFCLGAEKYVSSVASQLKNRTAPALSGWGKRLDCQSTYWGSHLAERYSWDCKPKFCNKEHHCQCYHIYVLCTISYLCYNEHKNVKWICKVGQSFSSVRDDGFRLFAAHVNKVTISFTSLLLQMTKFVADVCLAVDRVSYEPKIEFMRTLGNDITR